MACSQHTNDQKLRRGDFFFFSFLAYGEAFLIILIPFSLFFSGKMDNTATIARELAQLGQQLEREMQLLHQLRQAPPRAHSEFIDCAIRVMMINRRLRKLNQKIGNTRP
ncbi:hypothetical protein DM860_007908 [Cuscuta australis]|uniref:Uncharacterized protein n=1 Tax=Cuscuta australis TaxID=267555 RepID=A0A328DWX0_9ASTE|nr:hypothetical protein DM860_007908 [Cuscuta australis]